MKAHELARRLLAGEDLEVRVFNEETAEYDPLENIGPMEIGTRVCQCGHAGRRHRQSLISDVLLSCADCTTCEGYVEGRICLMVLS